MTRVFLILTAAILMVFGVAYLIAPADLATAAGLQYSASGLTDIRATYGGFQIGLALFLVWSLMAPARYNGALAAMLLIFACVGSGRLYGVLIDQDLTTFHIIGLTFEAVISAISAYLLYKSSH